GGSGRAATSISLVIGPQVVRARAPERTGEAPVLPIINRVSLPRLFPWIIILLLHRRQYLETFDHGAQRLVCRGRIVRNRDFSFHPEHRLGGYLAGDLIIGAHVVESRIRGERTRRGLQRLPEGVNDETRLVALQERHNLLRQILNRAVGEHALYLVR